MTRLRGRYAAGLAIFFLAASAPAAEDWAKWLGPRGDGISRETINADWPDRGPKQVWSANVGVGHSSPVAADGRVYLFSLVGNQDTLACFDAKTGQILWNQAYRGGWTGSYSGTRATPVIETEAKRIYSLGGAGHLVCRELKNGQPVWALDTLKATNTRPLQWGQASNPLIVDDLIYVQVGDGGPVALAVDKRSGKIVWQSQAREKPGYAHILQVDPGTGPQLVVLAGTAVIGMDPKTGRTLWREEWRTSYDVNAATPVYRDGHLFITSEYGHGCAMLRFDRGRPRKVWEKKDVQCKFPTPILDGDHLYANSSGTLKCMSWPDGKVVWSAKDRKMDLGAGGNMLRVGDKLVTMSERGRLSLVQATPEGVKLLEQAQVFDEREVWSTPLLYDGLLYAKGGEALVCLDPGKG